MNESAFIKSQLEKWEKFEQTLQSPQGQNPDELAALYVQMTDDLAYARTYFPAGEITIYLNNLTQRIHSKIYKNKREKGSRFVRFWKYEVPEIAFRHRKQLLYSFLIFSLSMAIGAVSAANDENFVRLIMGDSYVNMTESNIENEDPMAVYKKMHQSDMFAYITVNNIRVFLMAFAAGILFSFGTGFLLFYNGVMLGSFQYFFHAKGLFLTSFLTIWIHGTLEISAIIIAGAAGLIMGNSFLFPKTHSRWVSLQKGAKDGVKLVIGLVPIFIVAGFLESFVTRLTEMPTILKVSIIGISAFFILWYFVIYPMKIYKNGNLPPTEN